MEHLPYHFLSFGPEMLNPTAKPKAADSFQALCTRGWVMKSPWATCLRVFYISPLIFTSPPTIPQWEDLSKTGWRALLFK